MDYITFFFASAFICRLIQAKVITRMENAVMSFSFQLQKTRWCKNVIHFRSRVDLCYEIRDEELISTLHNGQLNTVYMTQFYS